MSSTATTLVSEWSFPPGITFSLLLAAGIYCRGRLRLLPHLADEFPAWRLAAFLAGLGAIWIAIGSPLEALDDSLLTAHMVQHILLMLVAPPFLLLGAPQLPLLAGLPRSFVKKACGPLFCWKPLALAVRFLTKPAACWLLSAIALVAWHTPDAFETALHSASWHKIEHGCFFATSLLFWWPVVQPWPGRARWPRWSMPLYLLAATLPADLLSAILAFSGRVLYAPYASATRISSLSPLADQALAGAVMWVTGMLAYLIPATAITMQLLSSDCRTRERRQAGTTSSLPSTWIR